MELESSKENAFLVSVQDHVYERPSLCSISRTDAQRRGARADFAPVVVMDIDPRAAERVAKIALLAEQVQGAAGAPDWGGGTMTEPDWDKKMIAEMIDIAKRQVWAISETLRVNDETREVISFGLLGERFVSPDNRAAHGGPKKLNELLRK